VDRKDQKKHMITNDSLSGITLEIVNDMRDSILELSEEYNLSITQMAAVLASFYTTMILSVCDISNNDMTDEKKLLFLRDLRINLEKNTGLKITSVSEHGIRA
jgi:hypothetical protein